MTCNEKCNVFFSLLKGLQTSQDARFYAVSSRFDSFSNEGKTLVIQFTVKHEQKIDCGGGYVKIFPADLDQTDMHGDSQYYIMFGKLLLVALKCAQSHFLPPRKPVKPQQH